LTLIQRMSEADFDLVRDTDKILEILHESMKEGQAVGINCPSIGPGIYVTAVDKILNYNDFFDQCEVVIVLKGYDVTGYFFEKNVVRLYEIRSVWPLKSKFRNPFFDDYRHKVR